MLLLLVGDFGYYAWVFVDVDLASPLEFVLFDMDGMEHDIEIHYENLPLFCSARKNVGQAITTYRI